MSISSEIERIQSAKSDIITAIENKGVTVPTGAKIDELSTLIDSIPSGGGGGQNPDLPANYTEIDSVKFTGSGNSVWLRVNNLNFNYNQTHLEFEAKKIQNEHQFYALISYGGAYLRYSGADGKVYFSSGSATTYLNNDNFTKIDFLNDNNTWKINGVSCGFTGSGTATEFIIGQYGTENYFKKIKLYNKENNAITIHADLRPCKDENNNVGFYDLVQNRFFTSSACSEGT